MMNRRSFPVILVVMLALSLVVVSLPIFHAPAAAGYVPKTGDFFKYNEATNLLNGTGVYAGYTEHDVINGAEQMDGVSGGTVSANYNYTYNWSNSQSSTTAGTQGGSFTWSSSSFLYLNATDDQPGYVNPTVWFYINSSAPVGSTVFLLNTGATVVSRDYNYSLPSSGKDVATIFVQGNSSYEGSPDNDAYGVFNARYTWNAYFDPATGFIVGYNYVEYDTNSSGDGFTWTDNLYVTSTSYPLLPASGVGSTTGSGTVASSTTIATTQTTPVVVQPTGNSIPYLDYVGLGIIAVVIIAILIYAVSRRSRKALPEHPRSSDYRPTTPPPPSDIDLVPREAPAQQIVIKEVAKVKCKFCGAMIDSTAAVCPQCGAPNN